MMFNPYLEIDEVARLEKAATNLRDRLLIRLLFYLGCRVSESLTLEVEDIDFTQSTATIQHLKSRIRLCCPKCGARVGKSHTFCPKCGDRVAEAIASQKEHRRVRILPINRDTLNMLDEYVQRGGQPRKYFRLTKKGYEASDGDWANPHRVLYGD